MAKRVLVDLDMNYNQLIKSILWNSAGNPSTLVKGLFWIDTTSNTPKYYNGTDVKDFGADYSSGIGIDITNNVVSVDFDEVATAAQGALADTSIQPNDRISSLSNDAGYITSADLPTVPTKISDLTDDTATHPIDKADTLTGLTATITELNYTDGVTSNIQTQLNGKQSTIDSSHKLLSDLVDDTNQTHKFATSSQLSQIATNKNNISTINGKIPSAASTSNQLADKQYVNNAVQTNSAHFRGNWTTWSAVPTSATGYPADDDGNKTPTVNDYMVVQDASDYTGETLDGAWQFTYTGTWSTNGKAGWLPRFQINEDPLTPSQQAALDSGITSALVTQIGTNQSNISSLQTAVAGKQDTISDLSTIRSNANNGQSAYTTIQGYGNIVTHNTSEFATSTQGGKADTAVQKYSTTNPALTQSGGLCTWTVTHSLGTKNVQVTVYETSSGEEVIVDSIRTSISVVTVKINSASNITASTYTVVVQGK